MSELIQHLLNAQVSFGFGKPVLWREIIGNVFGLASALLGMIRRVWAWPIGIVGNVLLFTVFLGGVFGTPQDLNLWGQAGRQVFFAVVSVYGWVKWWHNLRSASTGGSAGGSGVAVVPRWARGRERLALVGSAVVLWVVFYFVLKALASWGPASDAWILTGSILATYGMARGYVEFWVIWVLVDAVGVPLLWVAGNYPSALMYLIYGGFCILGFVTWWRTQRRERTVAPGEAQALAG